MKNTKNPIENSHKNHSLEISLKELVTEANLLFKSLDASSNTLRELESSLKELKANFPFRYKIKEEKMSFALPPKEEHIAKYLYPQRYFTQISWYLGWEGEDDSKNFRLLLISEEREIVDYYAQTRGGYDDEVHFSDKDIRQEEVAAIRTLSKKPLIETDLSVRLSYLEYLVPFIDAFKAYLKSSRTSIENGNPPLFLF